MSEAQTPGEVVGGKVSLGELGYNKKAIQKLIIEAGDGSVVFLARFVGQATDIQAYKSKFEDRDEADEGFGLVGMFEATGADGTVIAGSTLYLPRVAQNMAVGAIKAGNSVGIAMDVYANEDEDAATGYYFTVRSLIEQDRSALDNIKAMIGKTPLPSLPAPKK